MIERIITWLESFPQWGDAPVAVDYVDALPGSTGLYPQGLQEYHRQADILGNVTAYCRLSCLLYRVSPGQQDSRQESDWLLALQDWLQQQSAAGLAPVFGDDPKREKITAQAGKLLSANQTGTGKYVLSLTAEFIKQFQQ